MKKLILLMAMLAVTVFAQQRYDDLQLRGNSTAGNIAVFGRGRSVSDSGVTPAELMAGSNGVHSVVLNGTTNTVSGGVIDLGTVAVSPDGSSPFVVDGYGDYSLNLSVTNSAAVSVDGNGDYSLVL